MNATEEIWHQYHQQIAAFIRRKVSDDMAEDLLQDVFVKIHTRLDALEEETKLRSWLFQITRNTIIDHYRSKQLLEELPDWLESAQTEDDETISQELAACLEPMVQELPEKYRSAVQLSEIENRTQKEVAEREGISLSGAKSRVQRGRDLLKSMLFSCCEFELNRHNQLIGYEEKGSKCC